ncbi:MAG: hypothetical protein ACTS1Z_03415 [Parasphingopyxis sp.]|uniref:hypothetical protein n=1 Tax=Parasphingopyxis sp. TaxID=1920299 RepID=UPI003FA14019
MTFASVIAVLLAASSSPSSDYNPPRVIEIAGNECSARMDGTEYESIDEIIAWLSGQSEFQQSLHLVVDPETPWRCVGGLVFVLQGMGFEISPMMVAFRPAESPD